MKYKVFLTEKNIYVSTTQDNTMDMLTQKCFEEVIEFNSLKLAGKWRRENQKYKGQYCIVPCY